MATIVGGSGNETISGTGAADEIIGNGGNDSINGGAGNDTIFGDSAPAADSSIENATPLNLDLRNVLAERTDGTSAIYGNVATMDDGTPVSARLTLLSKSNPNLRVDLTARSGGEIGLNMGRDPRLAGETAEFRLEFFNQNTGQPVFLNTVATFGDIDRQSNGTETVSIDKQFITEYATSDGTTLSVNDTGSTVSASGSINTNSTNQDAWFSGRIEGQQFIEFTGTARGSFTAYTLNGSLIDDPDVTEVGEPGDDTIDGGEGNDVIFGQAGNDSLDGGTGNDSIEGGEGNDTIDGGEGDDTLSGGEGFDVFKASGGNDVIEDFNTGAGQNINDNDQTNNDFLDLSPYYDSIFEVRADLADDGLLNQSGGGDFTDNTALGGSIALTGVPGQDLTFDNVNVACFVSGTMIDTKDGLVAIEDITAGDLVRTLDAGYQPVRWIGRTRVCATGRHAPVEFAKGALGNTRALRVSPQHRMLLEGWRLETMIGASEALAPAVALINDSTIRRVEGGTVEYVHLMFDAHQIVFAEGIPSESYHPGALGLESFPEPVRRELFDLFPQIEQDTALYGPSARVTLKRFEAEMVIRDAR